MADLQEHETLEYLIKSTATMLKKEDQYKVSAGIEYGKLKQRLKQKYVGDAYHLGEHAKAYNQELEMICLENFTLAPSTMQRYLVHAKADDPAASIEKQKGTRDRQSSADPAQDYPPRSVTNSDEREAQIETTIHSWSKTDQRIAYNVLKEIFNAN